MRAAYRLAPLPPGIGVGVKGLPGAGFRSALLPSPIVNQFPRRPAELTEAQICASPSSMSSIISASVHPLGGGFPSLMPKMALQPMASAAPRMATRSIMSRRYGRRPTGDADHAAPFQCSMVPNGPVNPPPTAQTLVGPLLQTPLKDLEVSLGTTDQAAPFQ